MAASPDVSHSDPLTIEVVRGDIREAVHHVIGIAVDRAGRTVASFGDSAWVCSLRSCLKPVQASVIRGLVADMSSRELALTSASHDGLPEHVTEVESLLRRADCWHEDLACGPPMDRPDLGRVHNNCSGKHAAMLLAVRTTGWERAGYHDRDHPLQRLIGQTIADKSDVALTFAVDGCGLPCVSMPLRSMARLYTDLDPKVTEAMRLHPQLVGGPSADDTSLMESLDGWTAKRGAEGLLCATSPDGIGCVVKALDGSSRPLRVAMDRLIHMTGLDRPAGWGTVTVFNTRHESVGHVRVVR